MKIIKYLIGKIIPFNKVVKVLILSDLFLLFGWGLVTPILAIFITESVKSGDAKVAGIATGIFWLGKSVIQIPIAHYLDKKRGEKDDYRAMIAGTILSGFVPLGFIFVSLPWHLYLLQGIYAMAMAFAVPSWSAIFTRHIDKGKEALTWGVESSSWGIGTGVAGIIGGLVANSFGFKPLFIGVCLFNFVAAALLFLIAKNASLQKEIYSAITPDPRLPWGR